MQHCGVCTNSLLRTFSLGIVRWRNQFGAARVATEHFIFIYVTRYMLHVAKIRNTNEKKIQHQIIILSDGERLAAA